MFVMVDDGAQTDDVTSNDGALVRCLWRLSTVRRRDVCGLAEVFEQVHRKNAPAARRVYVGRLD